MIVLPSSFPHWGLYIFDGTEENDLLKAAVQGDCIRTADTLSGLQDTTSALKITFRGHWHDSWLSKSFASSLSSVPFNFTNVRIKGFFSSV